MIDILFVAFTLDAGNKLKKCSENEKENERIN